MPALLGKEYSDLNLEQLKRDFSKIMWFTYRKNFPKLNYYKASSVESHVSDTGWGCMIRVCQMLFAECIKRSILDNESNSPHQLNRNESMNSYGIIKEETYLKAKKEMQQENYSTLKIISWFLDSETNPKWAPYSIQNISNHISDKYDIQPGIWLKPSVVLFGLKKIHEEYRAMTTPEMSLEIFIDGTIYVSQVLKAALKKSKKSRRKQSEGYHHDFEVIEDFKTPEKSPTTEFDMLSNLVMKHPNIQKSSESVGEFTFDSLLFEDSNEMDKLLNQKWNNSVTITVLAKIGLEEPNPEYWPFLQDLLSYPEFIGMIGGRPGFAYFIVGCIGDDLIYLDPHFVQVIFLLLEVLKIIFFYKGIDSNEGRIE